ncbi:MAG: hypothetical protein JW715_11280 [Sedimentisphaerales bacterium]|nr:hypothetical protein [Sedimentisphaerales bacterium]
MKAVSLVGILTCNVDWKVMMTHHVGGGGLNNFYYQVFHKELKLCARVP